MASSFSPYPTQREDISYGLAQSVETVLPVGSDLKYLVPTPAEAPLGTGWTAPDFDDAAWSAGPGGLGFGVREPGISIRQVDVIGGNKGTVESVTEAIEILAGDFDPEDYSVSEIRGGVPQIDFGGSLGNVS